MQQEMLIRQVPCTLLGNAYTAGSSFKTDNYGSLRRYCNISENNYTKEKNLNLNNYCAEAL